MSRSKAKTKRRIAELEADLREADAAYRLDAERAEKAEAERDALRAQVAKMEAQAKVAERWRVAVESHCEKATAQVEAARAGLTSLLPGDGKVNNRGVDWGVFAGRRYLSVAGRTAAMEGDISRDMDTAPAWTGEDLKTVVEQFAAPIRAILAAMDEAKP